MNRSRGTIYNIQVLRAVAALLVVYVHLWPLAGRLGAPAFGSAGVDIFFVISGFIMVYTTARSDVGPLGFAADRICRIVPIYWLITLAAFALAAAAPRLFNSTVADPVQLAKSLLFIPFVKRSGLIQPVLFVGWTLNYEMFFYALFALGLAVRARILLATVALAALAVAGLIWRPDNVFLRFYTDSRILEFALGMWVAVLTGPGQAAVRWPKGLLMAVAATSLVAAVALPVAFPHAPPLLASGLAAAVLLWSVVRLEEAGAAMTWGWALALGGASYTLYLTHPFVVDAAIKLFARVPGPLAAVVGVPLSLAAAAGAALLISRWLEVPLTRAARRIIAAPRLGPRAPAALVALRTERLDLGRPGQEAAQHVLQHGPLLGGDVGQQQALMLARDGADAAVQLPARRAQPEHP